MTLLNKGDKIFIAGGSGMVGSAIIRKLDNLGFKNLKSPNSSELDLKNSDFNNENLKIKLIKKGLDKKSIEIIFIIFKNCQMARYTPLDINEMSKDFENIEYIVKILKKINEIN